MKIFTLLSALLLPLSTLLGADGLPNQPYLYVQGDAEAKKAADFVSLYFKISFLRPTAEEANKLAQAQAKQVFALLKAAGIEDKDIIASDLESEPEYELKEAEARVQGKLLGYRVTRPVTVTVRDIQKFPKLVDDLLSLKIENFYSIREGLSDHLKVEDEIREQAFRAARERADKMAKAAGMKVDGVYALSEVPITGIHDALLESRSYPGVAAGEAPIDASTYHLAPVTVSQSVHVIFLISAAK